MIYEDASLAAQNLIKTHYIVRVMDVHPEKQTVDVMQDSYEYVGNPEGEYTAVNAFGLATAASIAAPFVIMDVPVKQERWGQFSIQCLPEVGDTGYIEVFTDDVRRWFREGVAAAPNSSDKFNIESCVFVPFVPSDKSADARYPSKNNKLIIKSKNVTFEIVDDEEEEKKEINITVDKVNVTSNINITGDINVTGNLESTGDIKIDGDIETSGSLKASGTIEAQDEISSKKDVVAGGISLKNHTHSFVYSSGPTAGTPGTTNTPS